MACHAVELCRFRRREKAAVDRIPLGDAAKLTGNHNGRPVRRILDAALPAFFELRGLALKAAGQIVGGLRIAEHARCQKARYGSLFDNVAVAEPPAKLLDQPAGDGRATGRVMEVGAGNLRAFLKCQNRILQPSLHQVAVELALVFQIHLGLAALGAEQWRLRDVQEARLDQRAHVTEEKRQKQGPDVASVDIGVGHDDDLVVSRLVDFHFIISDPAADGGDQRADLGR